MSEIPEDIWEAAKATVHSFPYDWVDPLHTKAAVVARAILAERKRCAMIVKCTRQIDDGSEYFAGKNAACEAILEEIESGQ